MDGTRFHLVSLGCAKNTVDSESMSHLLRSAGCVEAASPDSADVLVVNTCGFIGPAREESLSALRALSEAKGPDQILIAAGCLTQRYGEEVARQVPGLDGILGTRRWMDVVKVVRGLLGRERPAPLYHLPDSPRMGEDPAGTPRAAVAGASAYLKIADGCRRPCAFCAIPLIKGTAVSRPPASVLEEARRLQSQGVRELILLAQDTTDYGHDLGLKDGLARLLESLVDAVPEIDWIRVMYAYPGYVTQGLIEAMAAHPQVLPYLDLPLQHAHPDTLRRMRRPTQTTRVSKLLARMRQAMPDLALRTTFIVGYPGETEEEFQALLDFVAEVRFDRLGVFPFSFEPGTRSESLGDPIPLEVKEERRERLMLLQQGISLQRNQAFIGRTLDVLIEGQGDGLILGRTFRDAPEVDGLVVVQGQAAVGEIVPVRIRGAMAYDLTGELAGEPDA